jgi:hypothetical protein
LLQDFAQEKAPIVYYAFDLLRLNGKNLQALPIEERKTQLEELLKKPPGVIRYSVSFTKDIEELLGRTRELGLEGLIGKRAGSVTYDEVGGMRSVPQILFGMMRLATLLLSLGWAKVARYSWIWNPKHSSPSRGILDRCQRPTWASRQDLDHDHQHVTLVTDRAFRQLRAGQLFIALTIVVAGF